MKRFLKANGLMCKKTADDAAQCIGYMHISRVKPVKYKETVMTLDDRIHKDLTELYNGGQTPGDIKDAMALNGLIQAKHGQTSFATKALPGYYTGDRKAKTVMVMLNPGVDVDVANSNLICDMCKHSMMNATDINNFHKWCKEYGHLDKNRKDVFDLKQAFFLHNWKNTGISLPKNLSATLKSDEQRQKLLDAKETILTQKLQLEMIPYASSSFSSFDMNMIGLVFPYVETLFEEIFSYERKYVIFCSRLFKIVFKAYNEAHPGSIDFKSCFSQQINGSKITGSCTKICIHYNNKSLDAIIANTFANQALTCAYALMEEYGDFCYRKFMTIP